MVCKICNAIAYYLLQEVNKYIFVNTNVIFRHKPVVCKQSFHMYGYVILPFINLYTYIAIFD